MAHELLTARELAAIERLALATGRKAPPSAGGAHRSVIHGRSLDVVEWRDYQPGDDPRTIDVAAWARLDQVLVRLYEGDVDLRVQLTVDTSASMEAGGKFTHAVRVAAAIGVAALVRNESLSVGTLVDGLPQRFRGRSSMAAFLAHLASWRPEGATPLLARAKQLNVATRRPGLAVVVSDFLTPDAIEAVDQLAARRPQIIAVAITSDADEEPDVVGEVQLLDVETGERVNVDLDPTVVADFRERRALARRTLADRLARHGSRLVVSPAGEDLLRRVVPRLSATGVVR